MPEVHGLVLPTQLFPELPLGTDHIHLVADRRYTDAFDFHAKKRVLHRASMQRYRERLQDDGYDVTYHADRIESLPTDIEALEYIEPIDHAVQQRLEEWADRHGIELRRHPSPGFITDMDRFREFFADRDYRMTPFYREQRRRHDILVTEDGDPIGGQWSFDPDNRKQLPQDHQTPPAPDQPADLSDAVAYVREQYPDAPGDPTGLRFPVTRDHALRLRDRFVSDCLQDFGDYQDAFEADERFLYHSLLSSSINIGLLKPMEVVDPVLEAYHDDAVPINAVEGFVRQIIGWREYIRGLYELEGEQMRQANFWGNDRQLSRRWYTGETGLPPVDDAIDHVMEEAYAHHIERLMVLGNVMLLSEIDPDAAYDWFMELFIDAYDWVMVPNLYGMSQYAWPEMMTKPYISSSNYIHEMSHYGDGDWCDEWDGLYWRFIRKHREKIEEIPRMAVMTSHLDRMSEATIQEHMARAQDALQRLVE